MTDLVVSGSCLCGSIVCEVAKIGTATATATARCHCIMCRKFHCMAYETFGGVKVSNFRWVNGEVLLKSYIAENGTLRKFCADCGSNLIFENADCARDVIEFSLGALHATSNSEPDAHIYTAYKADWSQITDDLPQFKERR